MAYQGNGPRAGRSTGRANNTLVHNRSRLRAPSSAANVPPPPVSPSSAAAYGAQAAGLQLTLGAKLASLRAQRGILQGQFRMDKAQAKAAEIQGVTAAEGQAIDRGILGSSADLSARAGVKAQRAADVNAAIQQKVQGLLGIKLERINAANEFYTGMFDIQARKAAEQAELANQAFLQDMVMRLGDEQGPPSAPGVTAPAWDPAKLTNSPARRRLLALMPALAESLGVSGGYQSGGGF